MEDIRRGAELQAIHDAMRRLFFIVAMFLPVPLFAASGPVYKHEKTTHEEFRKIYEALNEVRTDVSFSSITVSTISITNQATISSLTVSSYFMPPVYSSMTIGVAFSSTTVSSATAVTSFVPTNLAVTITPQFSTSRIKLEVATSANMSTIVRNCYWTFLRGSTNLGTANGVTNMGNSSSAISLDYPINFFQYDSPNTTSATTYTLGMRSGNAANTCTHNNSLGLVTISATELR